MIITLKVLTDIYDQPDETTKVAKILKKNVQSLKQFESTSILAEQYVNAKGIVSKKWSVIKEGDNYFRVNHKFEDLEKLTKPVKVKGFRG